jgi:hypothetical protein
MSRFSRPPMLEMKNNTEMIKDIESPPTPYQEGKM